GLRGRSRLDSRSYTHGPPACRSGCPAATLPAATLQVARPSIVRARAAAVGAAERAAVLQDHADVEPALAAVVQRDRVPQRIDEHRDLVARLHGVALPALVDQH